MKKWEAWNREAKISFLLGVHEAFFARRLTRNTYTV